MPHFAVLLHLAMQTELAALTPLILILLAVGLVTAIIQAALQIEDTTFSLLPKTFAMIAIALFGGFGALGMFSQLATIFISSAATMTHQPWS